MVPLLLATLVSIVTAAPSDGQAGCLFDGWVYHKGDVIVPKGCLSQMTCLGNNVYGDLHLLGGVCPSQRREVDGQNFVVLSFGQHLDLSTTIEVISSFVEAVNPGTGGCLFDGKVYGKGDVVTIQCLAEMTCLGRNNYGNEIQLHGDCSRVTKQKKSLDGQSGCLFDGRVYGPGELIHETGVHLKCLGHNLYSIVST